jgi:hypothetical protein
VWFIVFSVVAKRVISPVDNRTTINFNLDLETDDWV